MILRIQECSSDPIRLITLCLFAEAPNTSSSSASTILYIFVLYFIIVVLAVSLLWLVLLYCFFIWIFCCVGLISLKYHYWNSFFTSFVEGEKKLQIRIISIISVWCQFCVVCLCFVLVWPHYQFLWTLVMRLPIFIRLALLALEQSDIDISEIDLHKKNNKIRNHESYVWYFGCTSSVIPPTYSKHCCYKTVIS